MSQTIQIRRGLISNLPASAAAGELLFATDTGDVYIGTGSSTVKLTANIETNYIPNTSKGAVNGVATLGADSKIPTDQLPALAITNTYIAADENEQLSLTTQEGDVVVRTDLNKSYINNGGTAGTMDDYQELLTPTDAVISVNGATGAVTLTTTDISEGTNLYYTDTRATSNFNTNIALVSIDDLSDVDTTTTAPAADDYLKFDGTNWVSSTPQTLSIDDLSDVDTTTVTPVSGEILKFNGTGWISGAVESLNDIVDVNITDVADKQIITWDTTTSTWINGDLPGSSGTFVGLTDTPSSFGEGKGKAVMVNSAETELEYVTLNTDLIQEASVNLYYTDSRAQSAADTQIAAANLSDLNNVSATSATQGQVLTSDGAGNWTAESIDGGTF